MRRWEQGYNADYSKAQKLLMVNTLHDRPKLSYDARRTKHTQRCAILACDDFFRGTTHILNNYIPLSI